MNDWTEPTTPARGAVIVVGGRGETPAVYERLGRRLVVDGYRSTVVASVLDVGTGAERGEEEVEAAARAAIAEAGGGIPVVLVGSDSGAATVARIAASAPAELSGVVLAGLPTADAAPQNASSAVDDEVEVRSACPVHRGVLAAALAPGRLAAPAKTVSDETLSRVAVPALAVHGEIDAVSPVHAAVAAYRALPLGATVVVADGRHDILNDVTHRSVAAEIVQFLERLRLPGAPVVLRRIPVREPEDALVLS